MFQGLLMAAVLAAGMPQETSEGSWEAEFRAARVHLNVRIDETRGFSNYGRTIPLSDVSALRREGRNVSFELRRAAGTFRFDGVGDERNAAGRYVFHPDAAYRRALDGLGMSGISQRRMLTMAIHNVTLDDVRYLKRSVRGELDVAGLVRMLDHGADPEFVRGIYAAGFKDLTAEELVRTRDHGVDPEYIEAMRKAGIRLTLDEYVRARDHGVSAQYVRGMRDLGFENDFNQLVRARDHGVDPDFVRELSASGQDGLTLAHYIQLRNHGVTGDFAHDLRELGYKEVSHSDLIRLRSHGVTVGYARRANRELKRTLSVNELVRLRSRGEF